MAQIIVDDEQERVISQATDVVELRNRTGQILGYVAHGFTPEEIAAARKTLASDQPRFTTSQVLEYLRSLGPK